MTLVHAAGNSSRPVEPATGGDTTRDGSHDFDFWWGQWSGVQRKLKHRLAGSNEWFEFPSTDIARPLLGGRGNMDEVVFNYADGNGAAGATFRLYDPKSRLWSIYWVSTNTGVLEPPVIGRFNGNRGEFFGDDTFEGKPIKVRYIWIVHDMNRAHWEQAFSPDGGLTWETNWTAEFTRRTF